ncbi:coronin-2A isoform X2 [Dasypus novemcinctus]|nr:coronin-2A isoform X2 [Dasypus novemcinctus]XP_058158609.1 coronin-2A isoform X2 [Dasypus novemcinctus]
MSWHPQYRSSKFRHVFGKPASKENCYDAVPITGSVHDNHFCAVNPLFLAVVTECAGGGAFLVIPLHQTGKLDHHYPKVCGHRGNVLDIKWSPFNDFEIASCSEDSTIKIWDIPKPVLTRNLTTCRKELLGHARRVGLLEWHPTAANVLFSSGYDYKVMVWNLDTQESVIRGPVRTISCHQDMILSMSFNTNGSLLATTCKDRKIRVLDPRAGAVLQEASYKGHRASKVLFLGGLKKLVSTGTSQWNNRQVALWDQDNLSEPLMEEDLDGSSGVLFPFYDVDTSVLYVVGKGDGNIRYYEVRPEQPYLNYLNEHRSTYPQKGIGVMPKRGLDVSSCEIFRFYRLVTTRGLIEPLSMIVPRRSESYQEDIYPPTAGPQPSLTAQEWLSGVDRGPVLVSLRPGSELLSPRPQPPETPVPSSAAPPSPQLRDKMRKLDVVLGRRPVSLPEEAAPRWATEHRLEEKKGWLANGFDIFECPPPKTENELRQMFYRQQEEIRRLRELLLQREVQGKQLELELRNLQMGSEGL